MGLLGGRPSALSPSLFVAPPMRRSVARGQPWLAAALVEPVGAWQREMDRGAQLVSRLRHAVAGMTGAQIPVQLLNLLEYLNAEQRDDRSHAFAAVAEFGVAVAVLCDDNLNLAHLPPAHVCVRQGVDWFHFPELNPMTGDAPDGLSPALPLGRAAQCEPLLARTRVASDDLLVLLSSGVAGHVCLRPELLVQPSVDALALALGKACDDSELSDGCFAVIRLATS